MFYIILFSTGCIPNHIIDPIAFQGHCVFISVAYTECLQCVRHCARYRNMRVIKILSLPFRTLHLAQKKNLQIQYCSGEAYRS